MQNGATKKTGSVLKPFKTLLVGMGIISLGAVLVLLAMRPRITEVTVGNVTIDARVVDTPSSREQGLSDVLSLPQRQGMLFVFDSDSKWQFWMKDMHFNLDIIWLDASKQVVWIAPNATPASYPQTVFASPIDARYVLEVAGGTAQASHIAIGERATFSLP